MGFFDQWWEWFSMADESLRDGDDDNGDCGSDHAYAAYMAEMMMEDCDDGCCTGEDDDAP